MGTSEFLFSMGKNLIVFKNEKNVFSPSSVHEDCPNPIHACKDRKCVNPCNIPDICGGFVATSLFLQINEKYRSNEKPSTFFGLKESLHIPL